MYYEINESQAKIAKQMNSFNSYTPNSATDEYKRQVDNIYALANEQPEEHREQALKYADMYAKKLAERMNKYYRIECMCPSVMISGAGNFPTRKKEKQNQMRDNWFCDADKLDYYINKIKSLGVSSGVIRSGDADAIEQIETKIKTLEEEQQLMKDANAYYRKHKTLKGFRDITDEGAEKIDAKIQESMWLVPYATPTLTNNNAKIKQAKARLNNIKNAKAKETTTKEYKHFKVVENTEIMRIQLFFDGKPDAEVRNILKRCGFRYAPSQNHAWQRDLNSNGRLAVDRVNELLEGLNG